MVVCEDPWWMQGRVLEYFLWPRPSWDSPQCTLLTVIRSPWRRRGRTLLPTMWIFLLKVWRRCRLSGWVGRKDHPCQHHGGASLGTAVTDVQGEACPSSSSGFWNPGRETGGSNLRGRGRDWTSGEASYTGSGVAQHGFLTPGRRRKSRGRKSGRRSGKGKKQGGKKGAPKRFRQAKDVRSRVGAQVGLVSLRCKYTEVEPLFQKGPTFLLARGGVRVKTGDLVLFRPSHGRRV